MERRQGARGMSTDDDRDQSVKIEIDFPSDAWTERLKEFLPKLPLHLDAEFVGLMRDLYAEACAAIEESDALSRARTLDWAEELLPGLLTRNWPECAAPACEERFQPKPRKEYCSSKCRTAAHRANNFS